MPASFRNKNSSGFSGSRHGSRRNVLPRGHTNGVIPVPGNVSPTTLRRAIPTIVSKGKESQQQFQLPESTCTRQNVPTHATFALTKFASLLQYITPGSLVAVDIDDTLIRKATFGCSLLTSLGTRQFSEYLKTQYRSASFAEKQDITNALSRELGSFVLAEDEIAQVVRTLQERGVYVFGLTARSSNLSEITTRSLASLGIDLNLAAPPTLPARVLDTQTNTAVVDGIVYCNDTDKGVVFQRLLDLGWLSWPIAKSLDPRFPNDVHENSEEGKSCTQRTIWFVDDNLHMVTGMISQWTIMAENQVRAYNPANPTVCQGKLSLVCCYYTHPLAASTPPVPIERLEECINLEIEEFIRSGRLLTDNEALQILDGRC